MKWINVIAALLGCCWIMPAAEARPKLGVIVVIDQFRSIDVERWADVWGPDGFGGLMGKGAAHYDAIYAYSATETGPGHATIGTGAQPSAHGIVSNRWFVGREQVYAAFDPKGAIVGFPERPGRGPAQLRAGTLGDSMRAESGGHTKVVSLSVKDRAAILTAGFAANLVLWYDPIVGRYVTSMAYGAKLPDWAERLAVELPAHAHKNAEWNPLPIDPKWKKLLPDDSHTGEAQVYGLDDQFPHSLRDLTKEEEKRAAYPIVPTSTDDLVTFALSAVDHAELGKDDVPDLLIVSISSLDYVGHIFGPDSVEGFDSLRRADLALRTLVNGLESRLGKDGFVLALTGDHGSTPLVERVQAAGINANRVDADHLVRVAEDALNGVLGASGTTGARVLGFMPPHLYLDLSGIDESRAARALEEMRGSIEAIAGIAATYLPGVIRADEDAYGTIVRGALSAGRHGQLLVRQKPRTVFYWGGDARGTDHGTPYRYDRTVPLYVLGPGVRGGRYAAQVDPVDLTATLAFLLGVQAPDSCSGRPVGAVGAEAR
ncbi:MAG: alkaline phosphatase family protein [Myxococcales bacterium]|nr:alkaline phosphatase family protein [Myxococcales bacterium]